MNENNYKVPIIIGVLVENGIDVSDQILERLVTPQLIKIQNTFPNSPFIVLSTLASDKELFATSLVVERIDADVIIASAKNSENSINRVKEHLRKILNSDTNIQSINTDGLNKDSIDTHITQELFIAAESHILIAVLSGKHRASENGVSDSGELQDILVLRAQGQLNDIYIENKSEKRALDIGDVGLTISINPKTFDINSTVTPVGAESQISALPGEAKSSILDRLSIAFNSYIERVISLFDRFYNAYIQVPDEGEKDRFPRSAFLDIAEKIDSYNKDISGFLYTNGEDRPHESKAYLLAEESDNPIISADSSLEGIVTTYTGADVLSQFYQKKTNSYINWIYLLFFIAVLLYGIIDLNYYLVLSYVALIPAIAFLVYRSKAEKIEDRFLDYRALAEGLRVLAFWRIAGIDERVSSNYLSKYSGLVSWISRAIKNIEVVSLSDIDNKTVNKSKNKTERIEITNKLWIESQLEYYGRKRNPLYLRSLDLGNLALVSFVLTLLFAIVFGVYLLFAGLDNDMTITKFEVLLGGVAAIGVAAQAYKSKKAYGELERRYALTQHIYMSAQKKLKLNQGSEQHILIALGKEALIENSDWLWTHRNVPIELPKG